MKNQLTAPVTKILVATGNKGKLDEISKLLDKINIEAVGSFQYNLSEPEENGKDFVENSVIKARYYGEKTGLFALADDSGLCVELLDNMPGIYSARWAFDEKSKSRDFNLAFEKIKQVLIDRNVDINNTIIKAYFICNLSTYNPKTKAVNSFEGRIDGTIVFPARGNNGFGYDPIFIPEGYKQTFGEIDPAIKEQISHRGKAFRKLVNWLGNSN